MVGQMPSGNFIQSKDEIYMVNLQTAVIYIYDNKNEHSYNAMFSNSNIYVGRATMYQGQTYNQDSQDYQ